MLFNLGKFSHERRLIRELRRDMPDGEQLKALSSLLCDQPRRQELPMSLLLKAEAWAEKAMGRLEGDVERNKLLQTIHRGALGEVQLRTTHGL